MQSAQGNNIANQFILDDSQISNGTIIDQGTAFQSYDSIIAFKGYYGKTYLDSKYWDYSKNTGKYTY